MNLLKSSIVSFCLIAGTFMHMAAQETGTQGMKYADIYRQTEELCGVNPLLRNGVYYEDFYYSAEGHPFFMDEGYLPGSVTYRGQKYNNVKIRFDIFSQQLLILHTGGKEIYENYLSEEFVTAFTIAGKHFKKLFPGKEQEGFYQVVAGDTQVLCCYQWLKARSEDHEGNYMKYVFGDQRVRRYLQVYGELNRYRNNRSFLKALPDGVRSDTRSYIRDHKLKVKKADDARMQELMSYIDERLTLDSQ